jgi:prepilin-type N-terminal cleavage/methylation domain-containing protein
MEMKFLAQKARKAFTLIEILVVLIIIGLLASIVVVQVDAALTRAVAEKASTDVSLLNSAVTRWRASYPSNDFNALVISNAGTGDRNEAAFQLLRPFLGLPANITTLAQYSSETNKLYTYSYVSGEYRFTLEPVES